ncbi:MAG: hypothetical protein RID91_03235 [Azospirillaceae bacterium]
MPDDARRPEAPRSDDPGAGGSVTGLPGGATLLADLERVVSAETERARIAARGAAVRAVALAVATGLGVVGVSLVAVGVYLDRLAEQGPLAAGIVVGGGLVALAVLALVPVWALAYRRARLRARTEAAIARTVASSDLRLLASRLVPSGGRSSILLIGAAVAAGVVAGMSGTKR